MFLSAAILFTVAAFAASGTACQVKSGAPADRGTAPTTNQKVTSAIAPATVLPPCPPNVSLMLKSAGRLPQAANSPITLGQHTVTLSWNASAASSIPEHQVVGYCVYRRKVDTTEKKGKKAKQNPDLTQGERITPIAIPATSCVDDQVQNEALYSYVVTAVNAKGRPSSPSNEAVAPIPYGPPTRSVVASAPLCRGAAAR
jgi:hypothetical protein